MMRSRRLHAQKKVLFWLGSSWRKKILPKPVSNAIWKRANDVLSCEEHERQISSDTSPFEQNIKIPDGCRVRMGGLWLVELFPSSLSDTLLKKLDKSGWDGVHAYALNRNPNSEKAREARTKENIGWWRLGHDVDKGFRGFAPNAVFLDLPHGFESVEYNAIQIGSSLTVISAFFSPTEEMRTKLDAEWHAEHEPILLKQRGKRPRALSRRESDIHATQLARNEAYEKARNWLERRCKGFFSRNELKTPAADLLLFEGFDPTEETMGKDYRDAGRALGLDSTFHWISTEMPNLAAIPLDDRHSDFDFIGIVGNIENAIKPIAKHLSLYGNNEERAIAYHYAKHVQDILLQICMVNYSKYMLELYAKRRDVACREYKRHSLKKTEGLRFEMLTDSLDIKEASHDAAMLWEITWRQWNGLEDLRLAESPELRSKNGNQSNSEVDLLRKFKNVANRNFKLLLERDSTYRDILATASSIGADIASERLSRVAIIVALISLVVAIATLCSPLIHANG